MLNRWFLLSHSGIDRTRFWIVEFKTTSDFKPGKQTIFVFPKDTPKSFREMYPEIGLTSYWELNNPDKWLKYWEREDTGRSFYDSDKVTSDLVLVPTLGTYFPEYGEVTINFTFGVYTNGPYTRYHGHGGYGSMNSSYSQSNSPVRLEINSFMATAEKNANGSGQISIHIDMWIEGGAFKHPTLLSLSPAVKTDHGGLNNILPTPSWEVSAKDSYMHLGYRPFLNISGYSQCNITSGTRYTLSWRPR